MNLPAAVVAEVGAIDDTHRWAGRQARGAFYLIISFLAKATLSFTLHV